MVERLTSETTMASDQVYRTVNSIKRGGQTIPPGKLIKLPKKEADRLLQVGAIKHPSEDTEKLTGTEKKLADAQDKLKATQAQVKDLQEQVENLTASNDALQKQVADLIVNPAGDENAQGGE
ncbi:hypothetical protein KQI63_15825 [bacterium]|nr:hypothetical protein [bacterium]